MTEGAAGARTAGSLAGGVAVAVLAEDDATGTTGVVAGAAGSGATGAASGAGARLDAATAEDRTARRRSTHFQRASA
jgi:hypothetical protein